MKNIEKWYICWKACRQRCNNPNIRNYKWYGGKGIQALITKEQVKKLWDRDNAKMMFRPSLDRKNHKGNYTLKNCRFIELVDNVIESNKRRGRKIIQFTLEGKTVKIWNKIKEASEFFNVNYSSIFDVLKGRCKTCKGFYWQYK